MAVDDNERLEIESIAIIGAGPSGVAAAKYLLAEQKFSRIDVFEQRDNVGGVWNYSEEIDSFVNAPQTSTNYTSANGTLYDDKDKTNDYKTENLMNHEEVKPSFTSAMYDKLEANLPKMIMQYSDLPFSESCQLFPSRTDILEYLERYADDIRHLVHFNTQVVKVSPVDSTANCAWTVTTLDLISKMKRVAVYGAVIVTSGHHTVPSIPPIPGIHEWNLRYPGSISHSKSFRRPEEFKNKTVLIVGHGPSGTDISFQIAETCAPPIHISTKGPINPGLLQAYRTRPETHPPISSFDPATHTIHFTPTPEHPSPAPATTISHIIFCTGYLYDHPFLHLPHPTAANPNPTPAPDPPSASLPNTYHHLLHTAHPTLAFPALCKNLVPLPFAQAQAAILARLYAGRLALPSQDILHAWTHARIAERGTGSGFHRFAPLEDVRETRWLAAWCARADREGEIGRAPPQWGKWYAWLRGAVPAVKMAFAMKGEGRAEVRTLEELGFVWDGEEGGDVGEEEVVG